MKRRRGPDGRTIEFDFQSKAFWLAIRRYCVGIVSPTREPGEAAIEGLWLCYLIDLASTTDEIGLSKGQVARYRGRAKGQVGRALKETLLLIKANFKEVKDDYEEQDVD